MDTSAKKAGETVILMVLVTLFAKALGLVRQILIAGLFGATAAGIAFSASGLGLCHAISHALGGAFHVPHGRLNAILLPAVMEVNTTAAPQYAHLARQLGYGTGSDSMAVRNLKNALIRLRRQLELPDTLQQCGISHAQLLEKREEVVSTALADACCATNPLPVEASMIHRVLDLVCGHG